MTFAGTTFVDQSATTLAGADSAIARPVASWDPQDSARFFADLETYARQLRAAALPMPAEDTAEADRPATPNTRIAAQAAP